MRIYKNLIELIGHTPLVELSGYSTLHQLPTSLVGKVELFNPSGSIKARTALAMIEDAEQRGILKPGNTIIEPTSGNTGIALAMIAAIKGYEVILTMPESMSVERRKLLEAYGAKLVLTPASDGMTGSIRKAEELQKSIPGAFIPAQFSNSANPMVHETITGEEIWNDTEGEVDVVVAGVGTGGTIAGVARALKKHNPNIHVVAVEPSASPLLQAGKPAPHGIQGIGANFIPDNYDAAVVDEVMGVSTDDAIKAAQELAVTDGLLAGISSGAALHAARILAMCSTYAQKRIVVILPDTGERYLSTALFS